MPHRLFITGTDTDVGKTEIALALLELARLQDLSTAAMKPVSAGCDLIEGEWKNRDALRLQKACTFSLTYPEVNPVALQAAMSPHLAAHLEKRNITVERLVGLTQNIFNKKADFTVIEGAGGWRVPISHRELLSDYAKALKLPVVMVVGIRLGCLNHALLTVEAIMRDGLPLIGWIANCIDNQMAAADENVQTLERRLPAPCLGVIPFQQTIDTPTITGSINFRLLLERLEKIR